MNHPTSNPFDPPTLADDLAEVRRVYADFFAGLTDADWERPVKGSPPAWTLPETVAHLCALTGAGLASIEGALCGETYRFTGLENRYQFNAWNRAGIDAHRHLSRPALCDEFLRLLDRAVEITRGLQPGQAEIRCEMPIYNRPVQVIEVLSILMFHAGLHHSAQVAEPAGVPPLWKQLSPAIRRRVIGRVVRAMSLLYRFDLGGPRRAAYQFRLDGEGGGNWYIAVGPEAAAAAEGTTDQPGLILHLREPAVFCRMFTGRFNPLISLLKGELRLVGDVRLFFRMGTLFSVDAR